MVMLFRPINHDDLDSVHQLAESAGFGLTTLSKRKEELAKRTEISLKSFAKDVTRPVSENYFFVLEDTEKKGVVGTSAIEASVGYHSPFYSYRLSKVSKVCQSLNLRLEYQVLLLNNDLQGMSEIGTLFLHPDYRKDNNGLLLSLSRFMFMGVFPQRFSDFVIAEMRGVSDKEGISPFWESLGRQFFQIPFVKADEMSVLTDKQFISDLMPHNPIYTSLLSEEAQEVIGKPHETTKPAMRILEKEGFLYSGNVDIFDAGPTLKAQTKQVRTIRKSKRINIHSVIDEVQAESYMLSNLDIDYRATRCEVLLSEKGCIISKEVAENLKVKVDDEIAILPL